MIINKEQGYTSRDIVNIIGKKLKTKKVGHTGTLDPMATGVLVICINEATKLVEILQADEKEYVAQITLGIDTDTLDSTGTILKEEKAIYEKQDIINAINSMKGVYEQEVPIYSAIKRNGKKLYEYARENVAVELPKRKIEIKEIELVSDIEYVDNKTIFSIRCVVSSGCYIRSLARDIANKLNIIGVMSQLNRTKEGIFLLKDSYTLEEIEKDKYNIIPIDNNLFSYKSIVVEDTLEKKIKNGGLIKNIYSDSPIMFLDKNNTLLAIYKTYEKDNTLLKPWKMFQGGNK